MTSLLSEFVFNLSELKPHVESSLSRLDPKKESRPVLIKLLCNWCNSEELSKIWNKMSKDGKYRWFSDSPNNFTIEITWTKEPDLYVIINRPRPQDKYEAKKSIIFQMEPNMKSNRYIWNDWASLDKDRFFHVSTHDDEYNNNEWHLSLSYNTLLEHKIIKDESLSNVISTILSCKNNDPGQRKRLEFAKFLDTKIETNLHVYGQNIGYKNFKGCLPYHKKDDSILPYKYIFNAENNAIPNYYTEKLIDGILGECLTFYWGCPNITQLIDEKCYVVLTLQNFEKDYQTILKAIYEKWWEKRVEYIRQEKKRILNELQFFPRLHKLVKEKYIMAK